MFKNSFIVRFYFVLSILFVTWKSFATYVDQGDIERLLQHELAPISVGFDVDDTFFYSSPGFWIGYKKNQLSLDGEWKKVPVDFWTDMNEFHDKYSIPKYKVMDLIAFHLREGHDIHFITRRPGHGRESISERIREALHYYFENNAKFEDLISKIYKIKPVVFTWGDSKTTYLDSHNIRLYYGDSDSDRVDVENSENTIFVRVLRSDSSLANYGDPVHIKDHEMVLSNSHLNFPPNLYESYYGNKKIERSINPILPVHRSLKGYGVDRVTQAEFPITLDDEIKTCGRFIFRMGKKGVEVFPKKKLPILFATMGASFIYMGINMWMQGES